MTIAELRELPVEELTWQMLAAYEAVDGDMVVWAILLGLDPDIESTESIYDSTHAEYARIWLAMGDEFHERLRPLVGHWLRERRKRAA